MITVDWIQHRRQKGMFLEAAVSLNSIRVFTLTSLALRERREREREKKSADVDSPLASKLAPR